MAEIEGWFTMNGMHIPYMKGQSKSEAAQKYMNSKHGKDVARLSSKKSSNKKYDDSKFEFLPEDDNKARDEYYKISDKSYSQLSSDERTEILGLYIGTKHSYEVNKALRKDKKETSLLNEDEFSHLIKTMDKACETYTSEKDRAGMRYVNTSYLLNAYKIKTSGRNKNEIAEDIKSFIGSELYSSAFTSLSLSSKHNVFSNLPVQIRINIPKGTKMYVADNIRECEAILGRNTKMILTKANYSKGTEKIQLTYEVVK